MPDLSEYWGELTPQIVANECVMLLAGQVPPGAIVVDSEVALTTDRDVSFVLGGSSWFTQTPLRECREQFLIPAMQVLAEKLNGELSAAGPGSALVTGEREVPAGLENYSASAEYKGLTVQVFYQFDLNYRAFVASVTVRYGIRASLSAAA